MLEQLGIPTVVIGSDEFEPLAHLEATNRGLAALPVAVIRHPLGGISEDEVKKKAVGLVDQVVRALTTTPEGRSDAPERLWDVRAATGSGR